MKTLKQLESFMWDYLPKVHGENFSDEKDFEKDLMTKLQKDGFDVESQLSTQPLNDDEKVKLFTAEGAKVPDLVVKVEEGFIPIELKFDNTPALYKADNKKIHEYVEHFSDVPEAWCIFLDKHEHKDYNEGWKEINNSSYRYKWLYQNPKTQGALKLADVWNERRKNAGQGPKKTSSPLKSLLLLFALMIGIGNAWGTELFNLEVKASGSDVTVARKGGTLGLTTSNYLSSLSGGTATLENYNTSSGSSTMITTNSSTYQIKFGENTNTLKLVLSNALAEGDVITFTSTTSTEISFGLNTTRVTTPATSSKSYTIPAKSSLIGQTTIYLWRASGSTAYIKSVTITRPDPPTTWYVKGGWNSWGTTDNFKGSGTEISAKVNITTAGSYEFKIYDSSGDKWYGNSGNIGCNVSGWIFNQDSNCKFFASETGNYTFTFNTSTKALSVTYPTAQGKYYYKNTGSWGAVYVYRFKGGINNGWPGTQVVETENVCGDEYYFTYADPGTTLIFDNNSGNQTGDMAASGNAGKYVKGTETSWSTFNYNVTYDKNGGTGTAPTDATSYSSGASVPVKDNSNLTKSGYYFAGWNTKADGSGDTYVLGQTFSITSCTTLYAKWNAVSCPDGSVEGTVFSLTSPTGTVSVAASSSATITSSQATVSKGLATLVNGQGSAKSLINSSKFSLPNGNTVIRLNLGCALAVGDVISFADANYKFMVSKTNSTSPGTNNFVVQPSKTGNCTIPAGSNLIGLKEVFVVRAESSTTTCTAITITRPAGCDAPSALAAATPTAKGITLTVTDANDVNNYEFYVHTSSTTPEAGATATHSVSSAKSLTITNLVAGTTYYAWARTKCSASNKSDWVALTGNTFTTSTVTVTHTLTNVEKTSGATTAGGSDYTAKFAAVSGYSMPTPTVTVGGSTLSAGNYTWTPGTGTLTIPAGKINGNIVITLNSAAAAPSSVAITGNWLYFAGETIELTATPTGGNGPVTYQWYKGGKENGNAIEGATTATYTKATCAFEDAGSYYCKVTCGGSQSTWGQSGAAYNVKIPRLYVKTGRNDGVKSDFGNVDFTRATASTATASITLGSNWDYCFNIADGCGHYYGNAGTMQYNNYGPWTTNVNNQDCGLRTTNGATYVFTIDYSNWEQLKTTVTFPSSDQAADKIIYFDNQTVDWSTLHYRIGRADHTQATPMTKVPGTNNLYTVTTAAYSNAAGWHIANNAGWTGSNSIYRTYTNNDEYSITYATAHEGGAVTDAAVTVTPTTSRGTGADAGINDNCTFYNYEITTGMKTQNVAISDYSNGTITVNYVNTSNEAATLTSGNADLAHSVILTSITAVPNTGYDASAITINGGAYSANYVVTGATTIAASFTPHVYSIALNKGDHGAANQSASVAYLADALTSITHVAANTGYNRLGYYDGATKVLNADGSFAASTVSGYITDGVWTKTSDAALTAKWEAQTYTISYKDKGNKTYSGSNLASLPTSHTYGSSTALVDGVKSGYTFVGWYTDEDCTVSAGSSIGATAKTANFTLYAKWTYSCPADNSGETIYKFVPVTSSSDNIADATDFTTENYLSELTGGTLVSHCSASGNVKMNSNGVQLASSTGYLELNFECALQTGDKVKWKCYSAAVRLCNSTTYDSSKDLVLAKSQDSYSELYITSSMEGKKKLYLMHSGSNSTVMTFELYRAGGYNVTYKANGSGESDVAHVTATVEDNMFTRNGYTFTGWNTDDEGEGDAYSAGDDVTEDLTLYAQWTCITPTFGTNLSTTPHEVEQGDAAVTLTVAATANSGTVTYQWYSNTSKSTAGATTLTTGASYNAPTSSVGTLYYYCVATNSTAGCSTTTQSNYATVTVSEAPCLRATITKNSSSYSLSSGETKDITSDATITSGGAVKLVNYNSGSKSFSFSDNGVAPGTNDGYVEVVLPSGSVLDAGSVIRITGAGTESGAGLLLIDDAGTTIASQTNNGAIDFSYTVTAASTLKYKNHVRIARAKASSKNHFKSVTIIGCVECTPITPSLTYSKTTIWMDDADKTATPTLTGYYGTPTITYTSSDPTVVRVDNSSTGAITALKRGTATITATIGAATYSATDYCGNTADCEITVKDLECGNTTIAKATRSGTSASYSGVEGGSALVNNLDDSNYKLKSGGYVGVQLPSTLSFEAGDIVRIDLTIGDWWSGASADELPVVVYADNTGTNEIYRTDNYTKLTAQVVEFEVTSSMLTALATKQVTVYRKSSTETQNHVVNSVEVKRYACPDKFIFDDAAGTHEWSDDDNWIGPAGHGSGLPTSEDRVFINESVTVDVATASAAEMNITNGSMVTVEKSITVGDVNIETGSTLNVAKDGESGITVATNSLYLKGGWNSSYTTYDMPRIYIDPASTLTKVVNTVNLDISVDSRNYYPIAVPFKVKVKDVDYANSFLAGYSNYGAAGQYVIKEYNGERRAEKGPDHVNNWKVVPQEDKGKDVYLEPGRGYILTAVSLPSYGGGIIRFPMSFTNDWTAEGEQGTVDAVTKNVVAVKAYEGAATAGDKKVNKGWNLLGVPFMSCYGTGADMGTDGVVMQGKFDFKTGDWKEEAVRYVNVPVHDFSEYIQVDMEDDDPLTVLRPGWCFFVQVEEDGDLTFLTADQAASSSLPIYAPKRGMKADMPTVETGIILSDGEKSDKTTFLVSDKYNGAEYEINADLEKMFGNGYTLATYSLSGTTRLAYNALGNADAANIIPIGYRAPADGEYTFSINPRYAENGAFENVNLIDYETGIVTDLLKFSYTFSTERTQNDTRFALNVVKQKETPTDIELVGGDAQVDGPRKLLLDGKMYIILDGKMFDAQGKRVK